MYFQYSFVQIVNESRMGRTENSLILLSRVRIQFHEVIRTHLGHVVQYLWLQFDIHGGESGKSHERDIDFAPGVGSHRDFEPVAGILHFFVGQLDMWI